MARLRNVSDKTLLVHDSLTQVHAHVKPGEEFTCSNEAFKNSTTIQGMLGQGLLELVSQDQPGPADSYWLGVREYLFWMVFFGSISFILVVALQGTDYDQLAAILAIPATGLGPSFYCLRYFDRKRYPKALTMVWLIPFLPFLLVGGCTVLVLGVFGLLG